MKKLLFYILLSLPAYVWADDEFCWYDGGTSIGYTVSRQTSPIVATAVLICL